MTDPTHPAPMPSLIEAARDAYDFGLDDYDGAPNEHSFALKRALEALPSDAVVCSAKLLLRIADYLESDAWYAQDAHGREAPWYDTDPKALADEARRAAGAGGAGHAL